MFAPILPLDKEFNPLCFLSATICSDTRRDECVLLLYFSTIIPMVNNLLEYDMPISFSIDLSKHVLRYCIGCQWSFVPVLVLYLIHSCIQDWTIVGSANWQTVLVPQTLRHFIKRQARLHILVSPTPCLNMCRQTHLAWNRRWPPAHLSRRWCYRNPLESPGRILGTWTSLQDLALICHKLGLLPTWSSDLSLCKTN